MAEPVEFMGYRIYRDNSFGNFLIKQKYSGEVPDEMKGAFTTLNEAKKAINVHYANLSPKGKRHADSKSGDKQL